MSYRPYIICTTPRSGSFFLCDLLDKSGVAGRPHEYLTKQTIGHFMAKWGATDFSDYLKQIPEKTASPNGVFGVKVMWGLLPDLCREVTGQDSKSAIGSMLNEFFPDTRYIFLQRENTVRQAISLYKAARTGVWAVRNKQHQEKEKLVSKPAYDYYALLNNVNQLQSDNGAWKQFFAVNSIHPLSLTYEDCAADPDAAVSQILSFIGVYPEDATAIETTMKKQSHWLNHYWYCRYSIEDKMRNIIS